MKRDFTRIEKGLLKREFDEAKQILKQGEKEGLTLRKTAIIMYKCGLVDGKRSQRDKLLALHKKFNAYKAQAFEKAADEVLKEMEKVTEAGSESLPQTENSGERLENGQSDAENE